MTRLGAEVLLKMHDGNTKSYPLGAKLGQFVHNGSLVKSSPEPFSDASPDPKSESN